VLDILLTTVPFFALVLGGYVATRLGWLPLASIPGLNTFVLYFALPCLLFRFGATSAVMQYVHPGVVAVYLASGVIIVLITVAVSRRRRLSWNDAAFGALVAAFPNTGYMGVPLLLALLGPQAPGPAIVTILIDLLFTSSLCVALSRLDTADAHGVRRALGNAFRGIALNPMPWAILLGLVVAETRIALPKPALDTIGLLADAASPTALFTIGAVLARSQMTLRERVRASDYGAIAVVKLIVHPLLVWAAGVTAIRAGAAIDSFALQVLVLVAALPSASNVAMLAERFDADSGRIARIILASTAVAFLTFSAAVALVK
jgi:malonate transporter and related proteins